MKLILVLLLLLQQQQFLQIFANKTPRLFISDEEASFEESILICQSFNMSLVRSDSNLESILRTAIFPEAISYTKDLDILISDMEFWFLDVKHFTRSACSKVILKTNKGNRNLTLHSAPCYAKLRFICEDLRRTPVKIEKLSISLNKPLNFMDAGKICASYDGHLAYIRSEQENRELTHRIGKELGINKGTFWIGGVKLRALQNFRWYPSNKLLTYTNWIKENFSSSGNNHSEDERDCVALLYNSTIVSSLWKKISCLEKLPYICRDKYPEKSTIKVSIRNPKFNGENTQLRSLLDEVTEKSEIKRTIHGIFY